MTWEPSLCKSDRYVAALNQSVTDEDPTPDYTITLHLTEQELTELFSALMTGADLSYGDNSHRIVWLLWREVPGI